MNIIDTYESASSLQAKRVTSNEYAAPCPVCGGEDRLRMWIKSRDEHRYPNGNFYCRQCGASGGPERLAMLISSSSGENRAAVQRNFTKSTFLQTQRTIPVPPAITDAGYLNIVYEAKKRLRDNRSNAQVLRFLQSRGLTIETAVKYGLGYIASSYPYTPIKKKDYMPRLPIGVVIPNYRDGSLRSIKVRAMDGDEDNNSGSYAKYRELSDCPAIPYIIKANANGNTPLLIVESELDAILLTQFAGELFNYIGLGSASAKADTEVADMINRSSRVIFLPDYDEAGYVAYERWKAQFPKTELAELPRGKDPGEALSAGVDLKEWAVRLRMGSTCTKSKSSPSFRTVCTNTELQDSLAPLTSTEPVAKSVLAIEYDVINRRIALSDGDSVSILVKLASDELDWEWLHEHFSLCAFDPANLYRDNPALSSRVILGTIHGLYHAITGKGKSASIRKLRNQLLEHSGCVKGSADDTEQNLVTDAHTLARLVHKLKTSCKSNEQRTYYRLIKDAQKALGQMMQHGLLIDWEAFEVAGGMDSAKNIAAHRDDDDRVRAYFTPYTAVTGRLACSGSNLQSFPNELKHTVVAPEGRVLVDADYKQSEMRIAAALAGDKELLELFSAGHDIHRETASRIFKIPAEHVRTEQRQIAKAVNFGFLFGQGPKGLQKSLADAGILYTEGDCGGLMSGFARSYPWLYRWQSLLEDTCRNVDDSIDNFPATGIRTALGRRIPIYTLAYSHKTKIVNYAVQGTGAELTLLVLGMLPERLAGLDAKIIHCIHDEFMLEASEEDAEAAARALVQTMTDAFTRLFPEAPTGNLLDCGIGKTWADAKG